MNHRKTILLIGKLPPPYMGPSVAFEILINSQLKERFNLLYLDVTINRSLSTLGQWSFGKLFANLRKYRQLYRLLKIERPQLVLIPISQSTVGFIKDSLFIRITSMFRTKIVVQLRGGNFKNLTSGMNPVMRNYVKSSLALTNGVIVLGHNLRSQFQDFFPENKIFVVPNGGNFHSEMKREPGNHPVKILFTGSLRKSKGITDVLDAIKIISKSHAGKFSFEAIGEWREPETRDACTTSVNHSSLPVRFAGPLSGIEKLNRIFTSDIFVFTPREPEGHPWVVIEAMAAGLPVIATDQGAITESVLDGENGFIVTTGDPESIAKKLATLIDDPVLRESMGTKSRSLYEEKLTEQRMVENLSGVFEKVMASA